MQMMPPCGDLMLHFGKTIFDGQRRNSSQLR